MATRIIAILKNLAKEIKMNKKKNQSLSVEQYELTLLLIKIDANFPFPGAASQSFPHCQHPSVLVAHPTVFV